MKATDKLQLQCPSGMIVHPGLVSPTGTQTMERGEEKGKGSVYKTRVRNSRKAACAFDNTVLPPSLCNSGLYSGGGREGFKRREMCT
jgi:hypothetical protein